MIPIIYNISNDPIKLETSLKSLLESKLDNTDIVLFDNYNDQIKNLIYDKNLPVNIIQPIEKLTEDNLLKNLIFLAFSLYQSSLYAVILNNDFVFNKNWFIFMKYLMRTEISENIGIASTYNQNSIIGIDNEEFIYDETVSSNAFIISRRLFNKLKENNYFNKDSKVKMRKFDFTSKVTSYSYMKLIDKPCERFLIQ